MTFVSVYETRYGGVATSYPAESANDALINFKEDTNQTKYLKKNKVLEAG